MKFSQYIKDKWLLSCCSFFAICLCSVFLTAVEVEMPVIAAVDFLFICGTAVYLICDFIQRKQFYDQLKEAFQDLDEKSYLTSLIRRPSFFDGKVFYDILKEDEKYLNDKIAEQRQDVIEYKEYVQTWVHEIKTPIATAKLITENHREPITLSMEEEVDKIESLVEQMLYYTKSESVEEDYHIKSVALKEIISSVVKKNAKVMIEAKVIPKMLNLETQVLTDAKWTEFIISQLIENAVKYRAKGRDAYIKIAADTNAEDVKLTIADNGIGIPQADLSRVLKKGYTGENGRKYKKSTGMGLYLSKQLCDKMDIKMQLQSTEGEGTTITLTFKRGVKTLET